MVELRELYADPNHVVVTAHRGFSGRYPENTLLAFRKAIDLGVDLIEFDLRGSADGVPVVLHDRTLDRTSDGTGSSNQYTLEELRGFTFSYWQGVRTDGHRLDEPSHPGVTIPTFEQVLDLAKGKVGMNIQLKETSACLLAEICRLYDAYDLYDGGYLSVSTYREATAVREINPRIELCVLERPSRLDVETLRALKAFGCHYVQPRRDDVTPALCQAARELGLHMNMVYSNTDEDSRRYIGYGVRGILTDYPDVLLTTLADLGMR